MLVKKLNPDWFPSENKYLKVGETIEITDPKALIMNGDAQAVGEKGENVSAFELYGQASKTEMEEFGEYMKMKRQESLKDALQMEKEELQKQLDSVKATTQPAKTEENVVKEEKIVTPAEKAKAEKVAKELSK
jgi:PAB1-binding protein PBP1